MKRLFAVLLMLHGLILPVRAEGLSVKVGNHPGFGRVVFDIPPGVEFQLVEEASRAILVFTGSPMVPALARLPRNVMALEGSAGAATLVLQPGTRIRTIRRGQQVIVDAFDPARGTAQIRATPASVVTTNATPVEAPGKPAIKATLPSTVKGTMPDPVAETPSADPINATREVPIAMAPPPILDIPAVPAQPDVSIAAVPTRTVTVPDHSTVVMIPTAADVGAAAFRRDGQAVIVLDGRTTAGITGLDTAGPHHAKVTEGHDTTVITIALPTPAVPRLTRTAKGWLFTTKVGTADTNAGPDNMVDPSTFKLEAPGRVVSVLDPATGQPLLVGTSRLAGAGARTGQRTPGHAVLPTWQGVVVEPLSDQVRLLPTSGGFRLEAAGTLQASAAVPSSQLLSRKFDLPAMAVTAYLNRLHAQTAAAAAAAPRARGPARLAVAQSMLALGMATEAQAVLTILAAEDPVMAARADVGALTAVAALLSHRLDEAGGLDGSSLDDTDEIGLWRGIRLAWCGQEAEAGQVLPRFLPLVLDYPEALRTRLLPTVLETAAQHGDGAARATLAQHAADPALDYARALQAERDGNTETALAALDALAQSRNLLTQVRASARAAELRFASGQLSAAQTADVLDKQVLAWRGDDREVTLRLRVAELRAKGGLWRAALDGLRDTARVISAGTAPAVPQRVVGRVADVFRAMLAPGAPVVAPLDLVALASEFSDQLPGGADGDALRMLLAEKLGALDLPSRAQAVVRPMMLSATPGPVRAGLGALLAQSLLDGGDAAAARSAMEQSEVDDAPPALRDQRSFVLARIHAAEGRLPAAVAILTALATPVADELRARLLEQAGDWRRGNA